MSYSSNISPSFANLTLSDGNWTGGDKPAVSTWDDATWILTSTFIIFTMQSGLVLNDDVFVW